MAMYLYVFVCKSSKSTKSTVTSNYLVVDV